MARFKVLVSAPYILPVIGRFEDELRRHEIEVVRAPVHERLNEAELLELVGDIDGTICGDDSYTDRVMAAALKLKVISKWGTGIDSIDSTAARARGIAVCRTPGAFTDPVADTALGYILCFARNLPWMDDHMRAGRWEKIPGRALNESVIGVIGVGDIGSAVARRARPFGATVLGTDIRVIPDETATGLGIEMVGRDEMLERADFVVLCCDLNPTSFHLMADATLSRLRPGTFLINPARGPLIEEAALVRALERGHLGGVALDVFETEPLPADNPLRRFPNCLFAPHNANSSPRAWERVHRNTIRNLISVLEGGVVSA